MIVINQSDYDYGKKCILNNYTMYNRTHPWHYNNYVLLLTDTCHFETGTQYIINLSTKDTLQVPINWFSVNTNIIACYFYRFIILNC